MRKATILALLTSAFITNVAFAQNPTGLAKVFDDQVSTIQREVLALAQKMPADKYNFAPATGTPPAGMFDGVRNFGTQVKHLATEMYSLSSAILDEKPPVDIGTTDDGPANLTTKEQIISYFEGAIAFAHKAMRSITMENALQPSSLSFVPTKAAAAAFMGLHTYDHYGQMVVYARLNGITPGGAPPPVAGKGKTK